MLSGIARRWVIVVQVASALLLAGCENYASDIAAVQRAAILPGLTNQDLILDLAGERASVEWEAEGTDADDVVAVTATINRVGKLGMRSTVELKYLHDRAANSVVLREVRLNGKREPLLSGALDLVNLNLFKLKLQ